MIKLFTKKRKGFTLVELIVVVAILGLLAALAIPKLGETRANAEEKTVVANARTIASAVMMYQTNNKSSDQPKVSELGDYLTNVSGYSGYTIVYSSTVAGEIASITVPTTNSKTSWTPGATVLN